MEDDRADAAPYRQVGRDRAHHLWDTVVSQLLMRINASTGYAGIISSVSIAMRLRMGFRNTLPSMIVGKTVGSAPAASTLGERP